MSNDTSKPDCETGTKPIVFRTSTLGNNVRLGELYNQRTGQFLGVQLYSEPQEKIEVVETCIEHIDLSIRPSTTLEEKASLLDINAKLSLEILSGRADVSGSFSYFRDTNSNAHEQAFALALKMRQQEKRILFAEKKLGRNVLAIASEDYIGEESATHFVSSIVYGGNVIVNLVARQSNLTKSEKLEGRLKAQLNKLKGAIDLDCKAKAGIKDTFSCLDDKFDIVIHSDVAIMRFPINPKDLLDTIPEASLSVGSDGGVPISVTLQPVPETLIQGGRVYEIDALFVDQVLKAFSQLDDLRCRFSVLVDGTKSLEEFVPELARVAFAAAGQYTEEHGILLHQLRTFLHNYQHGNVQLQSGGIFKCSEKKDGSYDIPVLMKASDLYKRHLKPDDEKHPLSQYYPSTLVGLESEFLRFRHFVSDIQKSRDSVQSFDENSKESVCLSSIDDICRAIGLQSAIPLFVMTPFTPKTAKLKPDLAIVQLLAILRENAGFFNDPSTPAHILYVEDPKDLEHRLPNDNKFSRLESPSLFFGQVDSMGNLTWSDISSATPVSPGAPSPKGFSLKLNHKSTENTGDMSYPIDDINSARSFTFEIRAKQTGSVRQAPGWTICNLRYSENKQKYLSFEVPLKVLIRDPDELVPVSLNSSDAPPVDKLFVATFVQNIEARKWTLYLNDKIVGTETIPRTQKFAQRPTSVELYYQDNIRWWKGEVCEVKAFPYALTEEQVATEVKKAGDTTK